MVSGIDGRQRQTDRVEAYIKSWCVRMARSPILAVLLLGLVVAPCI